MYPQLRRSNNPFPVLPTNYSPIEDQNRNQTPSILHGPSFQTKEPVRAQLLHQPNRKPTDFSQLIFPPVTALYLPISSLNSSISALLVTTSAYEVYLATSLGPGNMRPHRIGFAFSLLKKGSDARM